MAAELIREPGSKPPSSEGEGGMGGALTRKIGPLPAWAWVALAAAGGAIFFIWRSKGTSGAGSSGDQTVSTQDTGAQGLDVEQYESLLALLRDIQGEVSTANSDDDDEVTTDDPPPKPSGGPKTPPPAKTPSAPKAARKYDTVVAFHKANPAWNSTLSGIAAHRHTSVAKLLKLNPSIKNPNIIHPGQKVYYT